MDHTTRTIIFGVVAVVAVSMGFATSIWVEPQDPDKFSDEGQPFFPDFTDSFKARAIEVAVFDQASSTPEEFRVEYKDGLWRIPSHFDYPADGADQLGKTAASVIGITRDSLESRTKDDHEEMGVVDPLDETIASGEGRGTRVTLFDQEGNPLVDYIIGRRAEGEQGRYYIRKADEERTYLAKLEIDLSTKFADWVEPDLLDVERNDIVNLYIDDYSLVETTLPDGSPDLDIQEGETVRLHREPGGFQWTLDGIDDATESLKTGVVNAMLTALDDLKFIGVRPKPDFFEGVLRGELQVSSSDLGLIARSLQAKGYYLTQANADGNMGLFSKEGSLVAGTADGVSYQLLVGNVFVGTQNEIEIGGESEEASEPVEGAEAPADPEADGTEETEEELAPGEQRSRYLFILTSFDEALLGPKPEPPVMPTPPGEAGEGTDESTEEATETEEPEQSTDEEAATDDGDAAEAATEAEAVDDEASDEAAEATEETPEGDTEAEAPQCDDPAATDEPVGDDPATETDTPAEEVPATERDATAVDDPTTEAEPTDDAAVEATADDDPAATDDAASDAETTDDAADATDAEAETPAAPTAEELQAAYETAMQEYEAAVRKYETDLEDYNERLEAGQKKVEELRERFAEWYFVIPADVFEDLDVSRADLVGPKTDPAAGATGGAPEFNLPGIPGLPEGHPLIPMPEGTEGEASEVDATDPMTETPEAEDAEESEESTDAEATTSEEETESETPEATPETPETEGSQSSESGESPAAEPDSETDASTIEGEATTPE